MSHDNDDDENEDGEEYECQNAGCTTEDRIFTAAPSEWFEERDLDTPKNCPVCRDWNEEQRRIGPITANCRFCKFTWQIEPLYRIVYHKTTGNWDEYWEENEDLQICRRCAESGVRRRKLVYLQQLKISRNDPSKLYDLIKKYQDADKKRSQLRTYLSRRALTGRPHIYRVPGEMLFYEGVKTSAARITEDGENRLTHILKPKHLWIEQLGTKDPHTILSLAHHIAGSTEPHILQFRTIGQVIKYDTEYQVVVIIRTLKESPTGNYIVTSYPTTPRYIMNKLDKGEWQCKD
jgi:hypothetical protein